MDFSKDIEWCVKVLHSAISEMATTARPERRAELGRETLNLAQTLEILERLDDGSGDL